MRITSSLCTISLIVITIVLLLLGLCGATKSTRSFVETFQFKENLPLELVENEPTCKSTSKVGVPDKNQLTREVKYTAKVEEEEGDFLVATSVVTDNPEFQFEEDNSSGQCYKTGDSNSKDGVCTVTW